MTNNTQLSKPFESSPTMMENPTLILGGGFLYVFQQQKIGGRRCLNL